jgi:hypothetical protein
MAPRLSVAVGSGLRGQMWLAPVRAVALTVFAAACGGGTPTAPTTFTTSVRVVDALSGAELSGVTATGSGIRGGPSDAAGMVAVGADATNAAARTVTFARFGYVSREVALKIPGDGVTVSLIPSTFPLDAFDELLRVTRLQRWTTAPPLRVQTRTLQFTAVDAADAVATDDVMSEDDRQSLEADLLWALPQLTGGAFTSFAGITRETLSAGARMQILNTGVITVARYEGLTAATGFSGYSRWQFRADGTVIGGTIMLDAGFDRSGSRFRRSLRAHELGHALGYTHVTAQSSVMSADASTEPTTFDRQATQIAFQRPPGNVRPDADRSDASLNAAAGATWSVGSGAIDKRHRHP